MLVKYGTDVIGIGSNDVCKISLIDETDEMIGMWSKKGGNVKAYTDYLESFQVMVEIPKRLPLVIRHYRGSYVADTDIAGYLSDLSAAGRFDWSAWSVGDVNGDSVIDIADLSCVLAAQNYGKASADAANQNCDVNNSDAVDIGDIAVILQASNYGKSGPLVLDYAAI